MSSGSFKILWNYSFTNIWYMYEQDLALNNLQELIHHKTQPKQILYI